MGRALRQPFCRDAPTAGFGEAAAIPRAIRILLLEDNPLDAELAAEQLRAGGIEHVLTQVSSRDEFIAALAAEPFDLILADYSLPSFDGVSALELARARVPDTPFVFLSGTLGEERAVEAMKNGASDYVIKHHLDRLPRTVLRALAEAHEIAQRRAAEQSVRELNAALQKRLAELNESQARLRFVLKAARVGLWELDLRALTLSASETCKDAFGYAANEPFSYDDLIASIAAEDRERVKDEVASAVGARSRYDVECRILRRDGSARWVQMRGKAIYAPDGEPAFVTGVSIDVTARKEAETHLQLMVNELNHRVKNSLAAVQGIAAQSLRDARPMPEAREAFMRRLFAFAKTHDVLTATSWAGAALEDVAEAAVNFLQNHDRTRVRMSGPRVWLPPKAALVLSLVLHELATNAVKYGALSNDVGHVEFDWSLEDDAGAAAQRLGIRWRERNGPPVTPPTRRGFGSRLIQEQLRSDLDSTVRFDYAPSGLVCTISAPYVPPKE